jgi:hypothetical protein
MTQGCMNVFALNIVNLKEKIIFPEPLNIVYLYYDMLDGKPKICSDRDYDEQMKACVRGEYCKP